MKPVSAIGLAAAALALVGCVSAAPLELPNDHPAHPKGAPGLVAAPGALEDYKTTDDFNVRADADAAAPARGAMQHRGMQHGGMAMPPSGGAR